MESLVVSLETAKKLKAAGFPQVDHVRYWHRLINHQMTKWSEFKLIDWQSGDDFSEETIAAPTAQEIADQLPKGVFIAKGLRYRAWFSETNAHEWPDDLDAYDRDTMAEALAQLYLKLKETK